MSRDDALRIYLAGKMSGLTYEEMNDWRCLAASRLREALLEEDVDYRMRLNVKNPVDYYNPTEEIHQSEQEVHDFDLSLVLKSDVVLVNLKGLADSIGTSIELYACHEHKIPVVAFGDDKDYWSLHPWVSLYITRKEDSLEDAVKYIKNFYMR